MKNGVPW